MEKVNGGVLMEINNISRIGKMVNYMVNVEDGMRTELKKMNVSIKMVKL